MKSILITNSDNSLMKSKKTKEEQMIFGKTVTEILKTTLLRHGEIIEKKDLTSDMSVIFFMAHAPLCEINDILENIEQYPDDVVFFKDLEENPIAVFVPEKILSKSIDLITSDWQDMNNLMTYLEIPYRVEYLDDLYAVKSKHDLIYITKGIQMYINGGIVDAGATLIDPDDTYIDFDVKVGMDTVLYPNTFLTGATIIGEDCIIGPDARVHESSIGNGTTVKDSTILESEVMDHTNVGPYAYIRPNSKVGSHVKVGDFVEVKNATIGDGTKISHLAYVGDADLGKNINIGCGVVFVNYNGRDKARSVVHDNAFIGCNSNIVSPVEIEELAYVAAGTTVTKRVPSGALAVGRAKQENKEGWVERRKLIKDK